MKTKLLLTGVVVAVCVGIWVRTTQKIAGAEAERAKVTAQSEQLQSQVSALEMKLRATAAAMAALKANEASPSAVREGAAGGPSTTAGDSSSKPPAAGRKLSPRTLVANDPNKAAQYIRNYRENLDLTWGGLFRKLGLTPEQIEKVKDFRVWVEQTEMDLQSTAETEGLSMQGNAYRKLEAEFLAERRKRSAEMFGTDRELAQRHGDYYHKNYLYSTVQRIGSIEMGAETPATFAQVERAAEIIAHNSQRRAPGDPQKWNWQTVGWSWQDWAAINWAVAEPQLQSVLSPAQYSTLRQFLRTQETWTTVASRNAANQIEARRLVRLPGG